MKTVILAGGFGTRISEESHLRPKPMIEIGGQPILWHIMKIYSHFGFNDFIICAGYKQHVVKEYFADYYLRSNDVTFDFSHGGSPTILNNSSEPWKVTVVDTGYDTMTGGRLRRVKEYVENSTFMMTYGDGVSDVDISKLIEYHGKHNKAVTLTGVQATQRFGILDIDASGSITSFREKYTADSDLINGGFMVLEPRVFEYLEGDSTVFEQKPLENLARQGELMAFPHKGYWQCMDTQRDRNTLEELWDSGTAPWKLW
jgi:glucose-1-phosphate cytidylyltransferase